MKIAIIGAKGFPSFTGADRVIEAIVFNMPRQYSVTVYASKKYTLNMGYFPNAEIRTIPSIGNKLFHMPIVNLFSALHALIFGNYDVIHVHHIENSFVLPILALKYKVVVTSHGIPFNVDKWPTWFKHMQITAEKLFVRFSSARTTMSLSHAKYWENKYRKKIEYIRNGVSEYTYDSRIVLDCESNITYRKKEYIVFAAGRIIPSKGCHILLDAYRMTNMKIPLIIIGDIEQMPHYGALLKDMTTNMSNVQYIPFVKSKNLLMRIIQDSLFFVFPSSNEAMSMMLLEVASLQIPIIASDILANKNVLENNALYFANENALDLYSKLLYAVNNKVIMSEMSAKAKELIQEKYQWADIVEEYICIYKCVIGM